MNRCDICGAQGRLWIRGQGRDLLRCPTCRFAWVPQGVMHASNGASIYEDDAAVLFETHADYYRDASAVDAARAKLDWVNRFVPAGGRLLDVGANFGHFSRESSARYDTIGIEPSAAAVQWARTHLRAPLEVGSIYDDRAEFAGRFQAITMFDVVEHLPDPRGALQRCRQYLAPNGRLFLTTPDSASLVARLLGERWYYLDLEQHIAIFSAANLKRLLTAVGFEVTSQRTFGRRYRFSYIERRLRTLGAKSALLRAAHTASLPLRLLPERRISINLGDVVGLVAERRA